MNVMDTLEIRPDVNVFINVKIFQKPARFIM